MYLAMVSDEGKMGDVETETIDSGEILVGW